MRVAVISGGRSSEREVSLHTGAPIPSSFVTRISKNRILPIKAAWAYAHAVAGVISRHVHSCL